MWLNSLFVSFSCGKSPFSLKLSDKTCFFSIKQYFLVIFAIFGHFYLWEGEQGPNFSFFGIQMWLNSLFVSFSCGKSPIFTKKKKTTPTLFHIINILLLYSYIANYIAKWHLCTEKWPSGGNFRLFYFFFLFLIKLSTI